MAHATFTAGQTPRVPASRGEYRPGACNIGPAEIRGRRLAGHVGVALTVALLGIEVGLGAPPLLRLFVAVPVAVAAAGYLQAWLKFCAAYGARGVFNFGALGETKRVEDAEARARDRAKSNRIALASLAIGVVAGVVAALLPL